MVLRTGPARPIGSQAIQLARPRADRKTGRPGGATGFDVAGGPVAKPTPHLLTGSLHRYSSGLLGGFCRTGQRWPTGNGSGSGSGSGEASEW